MLSLCSPNTIFVLESAAIFAENVLMKAFNFPVASIFHETMFRKFRKRFTETSEMYKTAG